MRNRSYQTFIRSLAIASCFGLVVSQSAPAAAQGPDYRLKYGDSVNVNLVGHPELAVASQAVRPDGQITLPLVKDVPVEGRSVPELTAALTKQYARFLASPEVVVSLARFRSQRITVSGKVVRAGTYTFEEVPTLVDVLAAAGGVGDRGARDTVKVLLPGQPVARYDVDRLLADPTSIPRLADGTVVEVDEVWYPDFYRMAPVVASVLTAGALLLRVF